MLSLPLGPAAFNLRVDYVPGVDTAQPLDVVALDGRVWGCRRKTTAPPAVGPDWMLMFDGVALGLNMKYDVGQYYWFEDELARPGLFSCQGGVVQGFSKYPAAVAYFESEHGQKRLVTQDQYNALHVATWHTNADGTKVGWDGIGGVNKFVWNKSTDTLTLPDLAGMTPEQVGYDALGVGDVHGDMMRNIPGTFYGWGYGATGVFRSGSVSGPAQGAAGSGYAQVTLDLARVVPVGAANKPRGWGASACVYLGLPAA